MAAIVPHSLVTVPTNGKSRQDADEIYGVLTIRNEKVEGSIPFSAPIESIT
jgi:hypothetical protein